jgi:outer membrane protein assembly factor BamB
MVGEFRLLSRLGSGGMGTVFLASSPAGRMVAVKIVHPQLASDATFVSRFRAEAAAARMVSGLYTAPVVADGVDTGRLWLATAFVPGPSLADMVARRGPLPVAAVWRLAAGLAEALGAIHAAGLVHRDLKPENVLLALDGPRVIDFGISRALGDARLTGAGMVMGTPAYMPPEHVQGQATGPAGDVFSLGCVLAFAASGTSPFATQSAATAAVFYRVVHAQPNLETVPAGLRELIEACLAKDPAQRPGPGQIAALSSGRTPELTLSPDAFWPPGVAWVIRSQQEAVAAQIAALQGGLPQAPARAPDGAGDMVRLGPGAAGPDSRAEAAQVPASAPAGPDTGSADAAPSGDRGGSGQSAASGGGSAPSSPAPGGPAPGGPAPGGSAAGATSVPATTGIAATDSGPQEAGTPKVSRRRLLIGAGAAGVAVIGGLAGWALSQGSAPSAGHSASGSAAGRAGSRGRPATGHRSKTAQPGRDVTPSPGSSGAAGQHQAGADAGPGQQVWAFPTGGSVSANPAVVAGVVYVGSQDGYLYTVNSATGALAWRHLASGLSAAPTVTAGNVCIADTAGTFYAINADTGGLTWQVAVMSAPDFMQGWAITGGSVMVPTTSGAIQVYDAANGKKGTSYTTSAGFSWAVDTDGGFIYALDLDGTLHAIGKNGDKVLSTALPDMPPGTGLAAIGVSVYLADTGGTLYSVDGSTGGVNWAFQAEHGLGSIPVYADGHVYFSDIGGVVYAVAVGDANKLWSYSTAVGSGAVGPAVAGGQVYFCTTDSVLSLDAATGEPVWSFSAPGNASFICTPAVADGIVYAGCQDNNLYAIRA